MVSQESCLYIICCAPLIPNLIITEQGVNKLLRALKSGKASGVDNLPTRSLKECANSISQVLTFIFNQMLNNRILPDDWKSANIIPLFKKGRNDLPENYRPLSLTSMISKTMGQIVYSHIVNHLKQHHTLIHVNMVSGVISPVRNN